MPDTIGTFHAIVDPTGGTIDATAYRVEVWGRVGTDGEPRVLIGEHWGRLDGARIRCLADPQPGCYVTAQRQANGQLDIKLVGLQHCATLEQMHRGLAGAALLRELITGRHRVQANEFLRDVEAADRLVVKDHARLTVNNLVRYLSFERTTFYDYLDDHHWTWPELRRWLLARRKDRTFPDVWRAHP